MKWLALPIKLDGYGYKRLMQERQGPAMFGAWCALLQLAASCKPRGTLQRSNGEPMSPEDMAILLSMPVALVSKTLDMLSNAVTSKLLWIEALQTKSAESPQPSAASAGLCVDVYVLNLSKEFDLIWAKYPRKLGKKEAFRHFRASVKTEDDVTLIHSALDKFVAQMEKERRTPDKIPYGSTWLNNWHDWLEYEDLKTPDEVRKQRERIERGKLYECTQCGKKHATMDGGMCEECYQALSIGRQTE